MNDLIINGTDHRKFDLEWAKRGGVLAVINTIGYGNTAYVEYLAKLLHFSNLDKKYDEVIHVQIYLGDNTWINIEDVRMATPEECADAGVEYIEPPARWFPIESAPTSGDVEILVWHELEEQCFVAYHADDDSWNVLGDDVYKNTKESPLTLWMPRPQPSKDE